MTSARDVGPHEQEPFEQLVRTVERSPRFSLAFAVVNSPADSDRLIKTLSDRLAPERQVSVVNLQRSTTPEASESVLDEVTAAITDGGRAGTDVICLVGLGLGLGEARTAQVILDGLNRDRERFASTLVVPVVFWLSEPAVTRIAREAPDFWAWRSGVFTFPAGPAPFSVFISSTAEDLKANRDAARDAALGAGFLPQMMEYFVAGGERPPPQGRRLNLCPPSPSARLISCAGRSAINCSSLC